MSSIETSAKSAWARFRVPGPWSSAQKRAPKHGRRARTALIAAAVASAVGLAAFFTVSVFAATPLLPGQVLNLSHWTLTLPTGAAEVTYPALGTYSSAYMSVTPAGNAVQFYAPTNGVPAPGSIFARSELRETNGNGNVGTKDWSVNSGVNTMTITEAIMHLPTLNPHLVAGQIHDSVSDLLMVYLNGSCLTTKYDQDNPLTNCLISNYQLGTVFTVRLTASKGWITLYLNGVQKLTFQPPPQYQSSLYFKAGLYDQSSTAKYNEPASSYGEVDIYALSASHS
jgi:hypothetical protein